MPKRGSREDCYRVIKEAWELCWRPASVAEALAGPPGIVLALRRMPHADLKAAADAVRPYLPPRLKTGRPRKADDPAVGVMFDHIRAGRSVTRASLEAVGEADAKAAERLRDHYRRRRGGVARALAGRRRH